MRKNVGLIDLEKAWHMVNRETLWQVLRMNEFGGKLLNGIKSMYIESSACVRVKGESEWFRIDGGMRRGSIMSPWLFNVYMDGVMKVWTGRRGVRFLEDGREWRLPGLLYADD